MVYTVPAGVLNCTHSIAPFQVDSIFSYVHILPDYEVLLAMQHNGKNAGLGGQTFDILCQTGTQLCDHFVGKASTLSQPTRPTQPSILSGLYTSSNPCS